MKKIIFILAVFLCIKSAFAITLPGIGKGTQIQEKLIKNGKIGYVIANKETITQEQLIQFKKDVDNSDYNWVIIHFLEDNTAIRLTPKNISITYGPYDKASLTLKTATGWITIIGNSLSTEDLPNNIFRE